MSGILPFLAFLPLIDPMADEDWNRPKGDLPEKKKGDPKAAADARLILFMSSSSAA